MTKRHKIIGGETDTVIGETTPIKIGLVLLLVGSLSGAIWWAATITAQLNSILAAQTLISSSIVKLDSTTSSSISKLESKDIAIDKAILDIKAFLDKDISEIKLKIALQDVDLKTLKDKNLIKDK